MGVFRLQFNTDCRSNVTRKAQRATDRIALMKCYEAKQ